MLGQKNNLPDVLGIMRDLAIDGLQNGMRLAADGYGAHHIFGLESVDRGENAGPAFFPPAHDIGARGRRDSTRIPGRENGLGFSPSLVRKSVKRERMFPARCFTRMATEFDFRIEGDKKLFIFKLGTSRLRPALVAAQLAARFVEVVGMRDQS